MSKAEKILAAMFLRLASDEFSNHGCNDMDAAMVAHIGQSDRERMAGMYNGFNNSISDPIGFDAIPDYAWMRLLSERLMDEAGRMR